MKKPTHAVGFFAGNVPAYSFFSPSAAGGAASGAEAAPSAGSGAGAGSAAGAGGAGGAGGGASSCLLQAARVRARIAPARIARIIYFPRDQVWKRLSKGIASSCAFSFRLIADEAGNELNQK
jgi:hypothetical protein